MLGSSCSTYERLSALIRCQKSWNQIPHKVFPKYQLRLASECPQEMVTAKKLAMEGTVADLNYALGGGGVRFVQMVKRKTGFDPQYRFDIKTDNASKSDIKRADSIYHSTPNRKIRHKTRRFDRKGHFGRRRMEPHCQPQADEDQALSLIHI